MVVDLFLPVQILLGPSRPVVEISLDLWAGRKVAVAGHGSGDVVGTTLSLITRK